jgi:hypothetical protein
MNPPDQTPGLDRDTSRMDHIVREDLARFRLEVALDRQDASADLARELEAVASVNLGDLESAVHQLEGKAIPSFGELERLLQSSGAGAMAIERDLMEDLLREGVESQAVLKRGLTFLKHRKYASAAEWWSLNRRDLVPETSNLHLLLLVLETLTHYWAKNEAAGATTLKKVYSHPRYRNRP